MAKSRKYHPFVNLWIKLRGLLALLIVLVGLAIGLLSLLLPFDSLYQQRLEIFLEEQWGLAVEIGEIEGSWRGYGPYFSLQDLELTGEQSIQLASANLYINIYQLIIPGGRTGIDLTINQVELDMVHSAQGASITINDDKDESRFTEMLDQVLTTGSLKVDEMVFNVANQAGDVLLSGLKTDFLLEQDENYRALQIQVETAEEDAADYNEHNLILQSKGFRNQPLTRDAQWYVQFNQFEISQLNDFASDVNIPKGLIDGELWLNAAAGKIESMNGHLAWSDIARDLGFEIHIKQQLESPDDSEAQKNWQALIQVRNISVKGQQLPEFELQLQRQQNTTQVKAEHIPIAWLIEVVSALQLVPVIDSQPFNQVAGQIDSFEFSFDDGSNQWIGGNAAFSELSLDHQLFNLSNLAGTFGFDNEQGRLLIDSYDGNLSVEEIYRGQLNWQQLNVQALINWTEPVTSVAVNNLWCACDDFNLQLWSDIKLKDDLQMILNGRLSEVDVASLHKYWPHNVWKEKTLNWLDEGLLGGKVETGFVFVNGDMVKQGFKKGAAKFISRAYTSGVDNRFKPEWPVVKNIDAIAEFDHDQVHVQLIQAQSMGLNIDQAQVDINSIDVGVITVDLKASSQGNGILEYIRQSPLVKNIELDEHIRIGGQQDIDLAFDVALKDQANQGFDPQGQVVFKEGQFFTEHFEISGINGPVNLNGYQLSMHDLPAQLSSADVLLNGNIATKSAAGSVVDVDLTGSLTSQYLLDLIQIDVPISGESVWEINIKNLRQGLIMTAQSALSGVLIDLPAPLNKDADENKLLQITCGIPCANSTVEINYNNEIKSTLNSESGQYHLTRLQFLESLQTTADADQLFGGSIDQLDLDQWLDLISTQHKTSSSTAASKATTESSKDWPTDDVQLTIKQLVFMSRAFEDIDLQIKRLASSYHIEIDSQAIKGSVIIDDDLSQKGIVAEFKHLNWIEPIDGWDDESAINVAQDAAVSEIPDIHLWAEDFSYAGIPLGQLRMEMRNVADGVKIEQLSLKSTIAEINIDGTWNKFESDLGLSTFNIVMFSEKIADFLQTVGFKAPITNAQTLIEMRAQWQGVPSQFNMATIDGELDIKIGQGQVLDQDPGFGRVLGLFNLTNLPRRLLLDFRDVLSDGLLFRSMEGRFKIEAGIAQTDDFLIKASSAKIHINGDVGFADQSYDQTIVIRPQIGKTFPTIGAIAGGPVGAAAGFLVQGLFDKQLKSSNEIIYKVTGSWDDPIIELIDKEKTGNNDNE